VDSMRALVQRRYGSPDALEITAVPRPHPGPDEVLVRVDASSVNARDWHLMRGEPRVARVLDRRTFSSRGPREPVRGTDFAGTVVEVGPRSDPATREACQPGDRVFGEASGTIADYVVVSTGKLARTPEGLPADLAAALPLAAVTALACLEAADTRPGGTILVNGASGGVGTFAVQLAKHRGLHVTAVCSARNADQATHLGADVVLDYRRTDFTRSPERYDVVLDLVGNHRLRDLRRVLEPAGTLVLSGGGVPGEGRLLGPLWLLLRAALLSKVTSTHIRLPQGVPDATSLGEIAALVESGALRPVIDRRFPFDDAAAAIRYLEDEHARAKVVILHRMLPSPAGAP
jgi:NADPH:quinone reductase-like Zn-dependent oxidoreductase